MQDTTDKAGRAVVVAFRCAPATFGLTARDRLDLHHWAGKDRRVEVEDGLAMIYRGGEPWAAWAIGRDGARLLLWDCITHADIGRFEAMREALAALRPDPGPVPMVANVIP